MEIRCLLFLFCGVLSPTMGSEVKPMDDPDLVETLINVQHWKEEIERRVSSIEKKSLEHKNQLLEEIEEEEVKSKNWADDLSLKLLEVRSIEDEFRSALERERQKSHSLQVQMTELISHLHSVDLIKKDVTSLTDNMRQHLYERLTSGLETIQSNLTENMRVLENSSLTFLKDVSKLEENLKSLRKSSKTELENLQSELFSRFETLEERSSLWDDVPKLKNTLTYHSSQLSSLNQRLWNYESFFDTTFILVAHYFFRHGKITCYSDRHGKKITFSRVLDTGTGPGLPTNASTTPEGGALLDFTDLESRVRSGAYECGFQLNNRSVGIVVPYNDYNLLELKYASEVAIIGDTAQFEIPTIYNVNQSSYKWERKGVPVPSWDGQTKVEISDVQPDDAGIYECYQDGERDTRQYLFRLIVRKCGKNRYGVNCDRECPACYNGGICHDLLGLCVCPAGFTGKNCELACGENRFGADCEKSCTRSDCSGKFFCKPDPFGCACFPGFTGLWCNRQCELWKYGADCKQTCHCSDGSLYCNKFTGACFGGCSPGWSGPSCQIPV